MTKREHETPSEYPETQRLATLEDPGDLTALP
jgi:hypothetical protein